jgi:hypothetical protein
MLSFSDEALDIFTRSYSYSIRVQSWLGGELLHDDIPVLNGHEEVDRSLRIPDRITLTVPRLDRGFSWSPVSDEHPLAANGQTLRIELGVGVGNGNTEYVLRGWFVIQDSEAQGDTVEVTAAGRLCLIDEARLISPYQPTGTLADTLRGLLEPGLWTYIDPLLVDRSVPAGINYDEDRLGAVEELLDAWPAAGYVNSFGFFNVQPADYLESLDPVLSLTNGTGGTIITATGSSTREGGYDCVVARGEASDGGQVQGVAYNLIGPKSFGGTFNPLPVPFFFASPLLTTVAQCSEAAETVLARLQREMTLRFEVEMVPHPALQVGDNVSVTTDDYSDLVCSVEYLTLPYTPDGGSATLRVRSLT